jgi:hypothetical protein
MSRKLNLEMDFSEHKSTIQVEMDFSEHKIQVEMDFSEHKILVERMKATEVVIMAALMMFPMPIVIEVSLHEQV